MSVYDNNVYQLTGTANTTANTGILNTTTTIAGTYPYYYNYPYYPSNNVYIYPAAPSFQIQLEKVENGWILHKDGNKYVITKPEQILKYLSEDK